jgi:hypothetical protein
MGLLSVIESLNTATQPVYQLQETVKASLTELAEDPVIGSGALSVPGLLYRRLSQILEIHKGALFVGGNPGGDFIPWAASGFDATSLHKMRINSSAAESLCGEFLYNRPDLSVKKEIADCFSVRDSHTQDNMVIFPFKENNKLNGFLLVVDSPLFDNPGDSIPKEIAGLLQKSFRIMARERNDRLNRLGGNVNIWTPDWKTSLLGLAGDLVGHDYQMAVIDLDSVISSIMNHAGAVEQAVKLDILMLIASFLVGQGSVIELPGPKALVIIPVRENSDIDLLLHQTGMGLKSLLGADPRVLPPPCRVNRYNDSDPEVILIRIEKS